MIWLSWRQLRTQVAVVYALVAVACVALATTGPALARLARRNTDVYDLLTSTDRLLYNGGIALIAVTPALLGIFWGAPLVARELENGTFRLAWNQSVTRGRWLAARLGLAVLAATVAVAVLTTAVTWWARPLDGAVGAQRGSLASRMTPVAFAMRGVVPVAYAVFALVLGTLVGVVLRRSVAAMALTTALYVAVQVAVPLWVRPHLVPPVDTSVVVSERSLDGVSADGSGPFRITTRTPTAGSWVLTNQTVDARGRAAELPDWFAECLPAPPGAEASGGTTKVEAAPGTLDACFTRLAAQGYRQHLVYQPRSRFWDLQRAEAALYLAASAALGGLALWWTRRRLS